MGKLGVSDTQRFLDIHTQSNLNFSVYFFVFVYSSSWPKITIFPLCPLKCSFLIWPCLVFLITYLQIKFICPILKKYIEIQFNFINLKAYGGIRNKLILQSFNRTEANTDSKLICLCPHIHAHTNTLRGTDTIQQPARALLHETFQTELPVLQAWSVNTLQPAHTQTYSDI